MTRELPEGGLQPRDVIMALLADSFLLTPASLGISFFSMLLGAFLASRLREKVLLNTNDFWLHDRWMMTEENEALYNVHNWCSTLAGAVIPGVVLRVGAKLLAPVIG